MKAPWLYDPVFREAMSALTGAGFEAFAVGGCVRDALLGVDCNDVDIATNALPAQVKIVMKSAGFKTIPTGVEHGTWTVRKNKQSYEITTYRHDVSTDGRRATVQFADTMEEDASRRDFTMNALYMDDGGRIHDPTGSGVLDAQRGTVRFVGDAEERCKEDLLRIMRLFRFHARYGRGVMDFEAIRAAIKFAAEIVGTVSGERIWDETKKILGAPEPYVAVDEMRMVKLDKHVYGKELGDLLQFEALLAAEEALNAKPMWHRRYLALFGPHVPFPAAKAEHRKLETLNTVWHSGDTIAVAAHKHGKHAPFDRHLMNGLEGPFDSAECHRGLKAKFPVTSEDMMKATGLEPGKELGAALREAKETWFASDLTATREDLLPA